MAPSRHLLVLGLVSLTYYLLVVLTHDIVGKFIVQTFKINDRAAYNALFLQFALMGGAFYLLIFFGGLYRNRKASKGADGNAKALVTHDRIPLLRLVGYLILTMVLIALWMRYLVVVNSELIHLPQYALLAILIFPLIQHYRLTFLVLTILGAIDEGYQYFVLGYDRMDYYDFNDVVLNQLGGALGLLMLAAWDVLQLRRFERQPWLRNPLTLTIFSLAGLLLLTWFFNGFDVFPTPEGGSPSPYLLVQEPAVGFWSRVPPNVVFHILRPLEGSLLLAGLVFLYRWLSP